MTPPTNDRGRCDLREPVTCLPASKERSYRYEVWSGKTLLWIGYRRALSSVAARDGLVASNPGLTVISEG